MTGQATLSDDSRADVSVHSFWKLSTTALFDTRIVNLDVGSYLRETSAKDLATAEKEKKDKYIQTCLRHRRSFTPMGYSRDRIPRTEAVDVHRRLALLVNNKLKREYSEMCGFVRDLMSIVIVRFKTLLLCGCKGPGNG